MRARALTIATLCVCVLAVAVSALAAGCGREQTEPIPEPEPEASQPAEPAALPELEPDAVPGPEPNEKPASPKPAAQPEPSPPPASPSSGLKKLTEDEFVEIAARILLASEGLPVDEETRITAEGLQELEQRADEIIAERGFSRAQVEAFEKGIREPGDLDRIDERIRTRFAELKE